MSAIGSDDDIPDPLEHKPEGRCPSCDHVLVSHTFHPGTEDASTVAACFCPWWDLALNEEQNRTRYAEEVLDDAYTEGRIIGDQRKYGAGREV